MPIKFVACVATDWSDYFGGISGRKDWCGLIGAFMSDDEIYLSTLEYFRSLYPQKTLTGFGPGPLVESEVEAWYPKLFENTVIVDIFCGDIDSKVQQPIPTQLEFQPAKLLLASGIALTPALSVSERRARFALDRYGSYFQSTSNGERLYLDNECDGFETSQKISLSSELGVGLAYLIAEEVLGIRHIADVKAAMVNDFVRNKADLNPGDFKETKSRKSPDYCGLTALNALSFFEAKGTTDHNNLDSQISYGKEQLAAVEAVLLKSGPSFVIAAYLAIEKVSAFPTSVFIDDPPDDNAIDSAPEDIDRFLRLTYAKVFRFAGADFLADDVLGSLSGYLLPILRRFGSLEFIPIGFSPSGDSVHLYNPIFQALALGFPSGELTYACRAIPPLTSTGSKVFLSNGVALMKRPIPLQRAIYRSDELRFD